jgi:ribosome maturation factor RimP
MCCSKFEGDTAKVTWILDMTQQQQIQGSVEERHEIQLSLPQRGPHDQYLHVSFDPGNKVRLGWSPDLFSPFESRPTKAVSESSEAQ